MENMNAEKNAGRKKLLVPIVVLIMCAVALTGAAYAYSTTVTMNNATVQGDYYSIDMYGSNEQNATPIEQALTAGSDFKVYTTKTVGSNYTANVEEGDFVRTVYVKVLSDLPTTQKYNLTATAAFTAGTNTNITITVKSVAINEVSTNGSTATLANADKDTFYKIDVTFHVAPTQTAFWTGSSLDGNDGLINACNNYNGKISINVDAFRVGSATPSP